MSLIIGTTSTRQLPAELVNSSRVKQAETQTAGKTQKSRYDTVEISSEAKAATSAQKTSSIFDRKIEWMEGESWEDFEVRLKEDFRAKCSEYYAKFNSGTLTEEERLSNAIEAATFLPEAVQKEGESDEDFAQRKLSCDTWNAWTAQWIKVATAAEHMPMGESLRYQDEQHAAWAADLMENNPAMFREYLELMVKPNAENGNFDVAHVPAGFTLADYNEWMSKDVQDYLN